MTSCRSPLEAFLPDHPGCQGALTLHVRSDRPAALLIDEARRELRQLVSVGTPRSWLSITRVETTDPVTPAITPTEMMRSATPVTNSRI